MSQPKVFFQIGTNDGNDLFRQKVESEKPNIVILVEPNPSLMESIQNNYKNTQCFSEVFIYNNAIYYENDKDVELVIPSKNKVYGTRADNGIVYNNVHFSLVPMNDWGKEEDMIKLKAKTITIDKICENHDIKHISFLQIDTEGFDSEIIRMLDFSKYTIDCIRFEQWGFGSDCFTKFNSEKAQELGQNGMKIAMDKLLENGYKLMNVNDRDGNDIIAVRNL